MRPIVVNHGFHGESMRNLQRTTISRRRFLQWTGAGLTSGLVASCSPPAQSGPDTPPPHAATDSALAAAAENSESSSFVELALTAQPGAVEIQDGKPTAVWQIVGEVLEGDDAVLQPLPGSYLGPILRLRHGQNVRIHFHNKLSEASILHWHGLHVPAEMDGHPSLAVGGGQSYTYEFEVRNRAGTYWYHPHPHGRTGPQVYAGMAGLVLISDDEEEALDLPAGDYDIPLVIQDRTLNSDNQLAYVTGGMMDQMMGFLGQEIWVNGRPDFVLPVETRSYRLRLLNGSNARIYKLGWDDGAPLTVIASDGGLLEKPMERPYVTLAQGERVELWVDFSELPVGSERTLVSLPFSAPNSMMGGGMMGGGMMGGGPSGSLPQGAAFDILRVHVESEAQESSPLPAQLSSIEWLDPADADTERTIALQMQPPGGWTLNGRTFDMTGVAPDEIVELDSIAVWEFVNKGGGMGMMGGMMLPHPMHIHGESFQVVERQIDPATKTMWDTVQEGYVDVGWKDTVLVMPGERVKVIRRFSDYTGLYLYHCHNLEHEDMGMMRNFEVA